MKTPSALHHPAAAQSAGMGGEQPGSEEVLLALRRPIAVVGKGQPASPFGEVIDRSATVFRIDNFQCEGHEQMLGPRSTWRATSGGRDIEIVAGVQELSPILRQAPQSCLLAEYELRPGAPFFTAETDVHSLPIGVSRPSLVLALLALLSLLEIPVDVFGFDDIDDDGSRTSDKASVSQAKLESAALLALPGITLMGQACDYASLQDVHRAGWSQDAGNVGLRTFTQLGLKFQGERILEFGAGDYATALYLAEQGDEVMASGLLRLAADAGPLASRRSLSLAREVRTAA
jgi:hypothetical protein